MSIRHLTVIVLATVFAMTTTAQTANQGAIMGSNPFTIISQQPAGKLVTLQRTGKSIETDDNGIIQISDQTGTINFVFADNNVVYIQNPVSGLAYYDTWVKGTLSSDGKTITVPVEQCLDYTSVYDAASLIKVFNYLDYAGMVPDDNTKAITYTIGEGTITLNDTNQYRILGVVFWSDGIMAGWFNGVWDEKGDYESVYTGDLSAIGSITTDSHDGDGAWYTLQGIRLNNPPTHGTYIHNGRKVMLK